MTKKTRKSSNKKRIIIQSLLKLSALGMLLFLLFVASVYIGLWGHLPKEGELKELSQNKATEIYDVQGKLLGKFFLSDRKPIQFDQFPDHLVQALLATEDARFYEHEGIDYRSLVRVFFRTILMQDASGGGGSTLSQQLAKNLFQRKRYGFMTLPVVKVKEMITAKRLEKIYAKDEILELYLNTVSFSGNTFGIESASNKFFNKPASDLSIDEASVLIGTLKATYTYDPKLFPERSKNRRDIVLNQLHKYDFLSKDSLTVLLAKPLQLEYVPNNEANGLAAYFREELRKKMEVWCSENSSEQTSYNLYTSGLKIYTTIDAKMQAMAETSMQGHMKDLQAKFEKEYGAQAPWLIDKNIIDSEIKNNATYKALKSQGLSERTILDSLEHKHPMALIDWNGKQEINASVVDSIAHYLKFLNTGTLAIDPSTGAVKTWIGGINFEKFKYDHVSQSRRQVGSTFKPIVYTAAIESGIDPCTYFAAKAIQYENLEDWTPSNASDKDEKYLNYSMKAALSNSVNTVAVKVLEEVGIAQTIEQARKMGIKSSLPEVPSLALGTAELNLLELAGAYAAYVNQGKSVQPYFLTKIEDNQGRVLEVFEPATPMEPAFSETSRQLMLDMMQATINEGTGKRIRNTYGLKNAMAGKTGTTQANKDAWFVAVMPKLITATWVGHDNHRIGFKSTALGQGANAALPIVAGMLKKMNADSDFNYITRTKFAAMDEETVKMLDCDLTKRDGFFKRIFTNPDKQKKKKFKSN
jgi:penicillin-binding protein 1A